MNGKTIKSLRIYLELTQKEFAEKIGVSTITISNVERGVYPVTLQLRMKIAQVYDVDQAFLETLERTKALDSIDN
jgi:transcriptional regulator with XRE-family HTH domain